ncbi:MAG: HAD hydrolase family protein [Muribaculaceae bacterium]|nr:HAD hydrolase family protein [Muribaculaceae bacterium]
MSKIPYDLQKIKAVVFDVDGVLSPTVIPMADDGIPRRMANLKDGYSMVLAVRAGIHLAVITGAESPGVKLRLQNIGLRDVFINTLDKLPVLKKWMDDNGYTPAEVAYAGDDVPDIPAMNYVGLPVSPSDGSRDALEAAVYITDAAGGYGVARELLEEILRAKGLWPTQNSSDISIIANQ